MDAYYAMQWPRENLFCTGYIHEVMNFRYNWHGTEYELNILLHGRAEYCRDGESWLLEEDDMILIDPGVGHASFALESDTYALVLRVSASAFRALLPSGQGYSFQHFVTDASTRYRPEFNLLRYCAARFLESASQPGPVSRLGARAAPELLITGLAQHTQPRQLRTATEGDSLHQETIRRITQYVEENYASKITLEELSKFSQYNRTYISTFFKNTVGMNFYEYLTRVRFQHALYELTSTNKNLTEIAIDTGFPDLKSFNTRFYATFRRRPAEYRPLLAPDCAKVGLGQMYYRQIEEPAIRAKLAEYTALGLDRRS